MYGEFGKWKEKRTKNFDLPEQRFNPGFCKICAHSLNYWRWLDQIQARKLKFLNFKVDQGFFFTFVSIFELVAKCYILRTSNPFIDIMPIYFSHSHSHDDRADYTLLVMKHFQGCNNNFFSGKHKETDLTDWFMNPAYSISKGNSRICPHK